MRASGQDTGCMALIRGTGLFLCVDVGTRLQWHQVGGRDVALVVQGGRESWHSSWWSGSCGAGADDGDVTLSGSKVALL